MRLIATLLLLAAPAAADEASERSWREDPARYRFSLTTGQHFYDDQSVDALSASPERVAAGLTFDYGITPEWWVGVAFQGGELGDELHDTFDVSLQSNSARLVGTYRWRPWPFLVLYGRLGPSFDWFELEVTDDVGPDLRDYALSFGGHVAAGAELLVVHPSMLRPASGLGGDFGVGLSLELTYDRVWPVSFSDEGTSLGELDPSGPGWQLGVTVQF